jgi:hypothetical protein
MSFGLPEVIILLVILVLLVGGVAVVVLGMTAGSKDPKPPRGPGG